MKIMNDSVLPSICVKCSHRKNFPKYSCKTCLYSFTSNFQLDRAFNPKYIKKYIKKAHFKESDPKLRELYNRIKAKYFDNNYIPKGREVLFTYKRGKMSRGGWCRKDSGEIRIGGIYRYAFIYKTESTNDMPVTLNFNDVKRRGLIDLLIHEAIHLRLAHHRKSFRLREKEFKSKVRDDDVKELYMDLIDKGDSNVCI